MKMNTKTRRDSVDRKYHNIFHFMYGVLDDNTYWISSSRNAILRIDKFTLQVLLDLNTGKSMREVAKKYNIQIDEVVNTYNRLYKNGFVVKEGFGKIKRSNPTEDIDITPYLLLFLTMAIGQIFYFTHIARTALVNKTSEALIISAIALAAVFFHELGHYLFCWRYTRIRPKMGFTMLSVFPAVYVDTNLSWRLPKNKRLAINMSGILFDLAVNTYAVLLVLTNGSLEYFVTPFLLMQYVRMSILINPVFKGDGYWLLSDVLGIVHMRKKGLRELKKGKLNFFSLYGLLTLIFSTAATLGLVWFIVNLTRPLFVKFVVPLIK